MASISINRYTPYDQIIYRGAIYRADMTVPNDDLGLVKRLHMRANMFRRKGDNIRILNNGGWTILYVRNNQSELNIS
jgi:hypothetical protein